MKLFLPFFPFTLELAWKDNAIVYISQAIAKGGVLQTIGFVIKNSGLSMMLLTPSPISLSLVKNPKPRKTCV